MASCWPGCVVGRLRTRPLCHSSFETADSAAFFVAAVVGAPSVSSHASSVFYDGVDFFDGQGMYTQRYT